MICNHYICLHVQNFQNYYILSNDCFAWIVYLLFFVNIELYFYLLDFKMLWYLFRPGQMHFLAILKVHFYGLQTNKRNNPVKFGADLNHRPDTNVIYNILLKVHYATFLQSVNKQRTEFLMQETVVFRS